MNIAFSSFHVRAVAIVTIAALVAWTFGLPSWIHTASAANVTNFSDTLSTSEPSVGAQHTIALTTASAWGDVADQLFEFALDPDTNFFDASAITFGDLTLSPGTISLVNGSGSCAGGTEIFFDSGNSDANTVAFGVCAGDTIATGTALTFEIGTGNTITNPATSSTSYVIRLQGAIPDNGDTRVAITDTVTVTAAVETTFAFRVQGTSTGLTINDEPVATVDSTTATSVAFGTVSPGGGNAEFLAQRLEVDTNALNGFTVTVFADQTLTAGNLATIDEFIDGAGTGSSTLWASPSNTFGTPDTYGHWGLTSDDDDVGSSTLVYGVGSALYVGNFINNPIPVFYHNAAVDDTNNEQAGESFAHVGYKIEIGTLQEAATDYQATLTYVATPVF